MPPTLTAARRWTRPRPSSTTRSSSFWSRRAPDRERPSQDPPRRRRTGNRGGCVARSECLRVASRLQSCRLMRHLVAAATALLLAAVNVSAAKTLDIYFIDVEGGQSTLVVTPAGQSLLIDTGYPEPAARDPDRIMAAVRDAHLARIDYLLITHLHEDHDGGAAELARRIPIGTFVDYGAPVETGKDVVEAFAAYEQARARGRHIMPSPGDRLPLDGVVVDVVSAGGATLTKPLDGAGQPNPACAGFEPRPRDITAENPRSIGVRVAFGAFRFLDLGDLGWNKLGELVCPNNLIGDVEVYLVAHHANGDANVPALLSALRPRVAIANNGPYQRPHAA